MLFEELKDVVFCTCILQLSDHFDLIFS